jgi:hypothetical protein
MLDSPLYPSIKPVTQIWSAGVIFVRSLRSSPTAGPHKRRPNCCLYNACDRGDERRVHAVPTQSVLLHTRSKLLQRFDIGFHQKHRTEALSFCSSPPSKIHAISTGPALGFVCFGCDDASSAAISRSVQAAHQQSAVSRHFIVRLPVNGRLSPGRDKIWEPYLDVNPESVQFRIIRSEIPAGAADPFLRAAHVLDDHRDM